MSGYSNSPKLLKVGIVLIDPESAQVRRIITLQYNPDSLSRSFQAQAFSSERKPGGQSRVRQLRRAGHRRHFMIDPLQAFLEAHSLQGPLFPNTSRYQRPSIDRGQSIDRGSSQFISGLPYVRQMEASSSQTRHLAEFRPTVHGGSAMRGGIDFARTARQRLRKAQDKRTSETIETIGDRPRLLNLGSGTIEYFRKPNGLGPQ